MYHLEKAEVVFLATDTSQHYDVSDIHSSQLIRLANSRRNRLANSRRASNVVSIYAGSSGDNVISAL